MKTAMTGSNCASLAGLAAGALVLIATVAGCSPGAPKLNPEVCDVVEERLKYARSELEGYYAAVTFLVDAGMETRDAQRQAKASIDQYCPEYAGLYKSGHL